MNHIFETQVKMGLNLSAKLENDLTDLVKADQQELWKHQNKAAIEAYNQMIEENGVFSDVLRGAFNGSQ